MNTYPVLSKEFETYVNFLNNYNESYNLNLNNDIFKSCIKSLYNDLITSYEWVELNFDELKVNVESIDIVSQIPKPDLFNSKYIPIEVKSDILNQSQFMISYYFSIGKRKVNVVFVTSNDIRNKYHIFDNYFKKIMSWIYIANNYSSINCGTNLNIYI